MQYNRLAGAFEKRAELFFGSRKFHRTLGESLFKRRVKLADFAFSVLLCANIAIDEGKQGALTERDCRHHYIKRQLASVIPARRPLEAVAALSQR
jgi:hypothetical protein